MKKVIAVIILIALVGTGVFMALGNDQDTTKTQNQTNNIPAANTNRDSEPNNSAEVNTIIYSDSGFSATNINAKAGDVITVRNSSSRTLDFASDEHPTHQDNPDLNIGNIESGQTATFSAKSGTWGYHNHLNPRDEGTITIKE